MSAFSTELRPGFSGATWRRMASLAAPLTAYFLIQSTINIAVLAMVGRLGTTAVAGIGIAQAVYGVLLALLYGFDTGVQAVVARAWGAEAYETAGRALTEALMASVPLGVALTMFLYGDSARLIGALTQDPATCHAALSYIYAEAPSLALFATTIPFNAYWIGSGVPRVSFWITCLLTPLQVGLSVLFIFGAGTLPAFGLPGAGLAVLAAAFAGLVVQLLVAVRRRVPGLFARPKIPGIVTILKLGWPVSAQQALGQVALLIAFAIVALLGTAQIAMLNVLATLMLLPIQVTTGLGMAASTLAGQALGRGDATDARRQGWRVGTAGLLVTLPLCLLVLIEPQFVLVHFLDDPVIRAMTLRPAQLLGISIPIGTFAGIMGYALRGTGATRIATAIPFLAHFVVELPMIWLMGVRLHGGFDAIVAVQVALTFAEAGLYFLVWRRGNWAYVRIAGITGPEVRTTRGRCAVASCSRIAVFGGAGAGKSTLSRALGEALSLPVIHLDRLVYGPAWSKRDLKAVRADLADALKTDRWITDGIYGELNDLILPRADLVIWIEQPFFRRLWRTWRKTRIGRTSPRSDRPDDCDEVFGVHYIMVIASFGRFTRRIQERLARQTAARTICVKGDREVAEFVRQITNRG